MEDAVQINGVWQEMIDAWASAVVARTKIEEFTGGLMTAKYQANLDSQGLGPERIAVGRKVAYPKIPYVIWLMARASRQERRPHA